MIVIIVIGRAIDRAPYVIGFIIINEWMDDDVRGRPKALNWEYVKKGNERAELYREVGEKRRVRRLWPPFILCVQN